MAPGGIVISQSEDDEVEIVLLFVLKQQQKYLKPMSPTN